MWLSIYWISMAMATEWNISPTGTHDSILTATQKAQSGDVIVLQAGIYKECINNMGKDLHIKGNSGAKVVGNGNCSSLVTIQNGELWLESIFLSHNSTCIFVDGRFANLIGQDLTIAQCGNHNIKGGGVRIQEGRANIQQSKISGALALNGAGIFVDHGVVKLKDVLLTDNIALMGSGLFAQNSEVSMHNTRIIGNETKSGGFGAGLVFKEGNLVELNQIAIQNNHSQGHGGGIYVLSTEQPNQLTLKQSTIQSNTASFDTSSGGGIYATGANHLLIQNSVIQDNTASLQGGGLFLENMGHEILIMDSKIAKNRARDGDGGGIYVLASTPDKAAMLRLKRVILEDNRAQIQGGAIALGTVKQPYGSLEVIESQLRRNQSISSQVGAGGAISYISQPPFTLKIQSSIFEYNAAEMNGGAIYAKSPQMMWIEESQFFHNNAQGPSTSQARYGGALMLDSPTVVFLDQSQFCHNRSTSTGGVRSSGSGGAIYIQNAERIESNHLYLWENEAQASGGAIALENVKQFSFDQGLIIGNRAKIGGAIWENLSSIEISNSTIAYTQAGEAFTAQNALFKSINWYNNAEGNGIDFGSNSDHLNLRPKFRNVIIDGKCDDDFREN